MNARDYLNLLRRRILVIAQAALIVPIAAFAFSITQEKRYEATADILLTPQSVTADLTGGLDTAYAQSERNLQTQVEIARVPAVAQRVLDALDLTETVSPEAFLAQSSVSTRPNVDVLEFRVTDGDPELARRLATEYARQFTVYRRELDTGAIVRARRDIERLLDQLAAEGSRRTPLYQNLAEKAQQLRTAEALRTTNTLLMREARGAAQVEPTPVRDALLGLLLGLLIGIGLALLLETLDTRVRSAEEIAERLRLVLLARVPELPRRLRSRHRIAMLEQPGGVHAEAFRMLRTNLDFATLDRGARTIMFTSAVAGEGKSTTLANLAVALARAGRRVIVADLDLRRPTLDRLLGLDGRAGVTEVTLGTVALEDALVSIPVDDATRPRKRLFGRNGNGGNGFEDPAGTLDVLPAGEQLPTDPGEFVGTDALGSLLEELRERADVVLIDAPPALQVGDAMTLSVKVDALVVVARANHVRRPMLAELRRLLDASPALKLGFVLTGTGPAEGYGYNSAYYNDVGTYSAAREPVA